MGDLGVGLLCTESNFILKNGSELIWQANSNLDVLPLGHVDNSK